jgi:hypothetical protein
MPARISAERWRVVIPYLDAALELDEGDRHAWLDALRRQDGSLAADVALLLEKHDLLDAQGYLDAGIQGPRARSRWPARCWAPTRCASSWGRAAWARLAGGPHRRALPGHGRRQAAQPELGRPRGRRPLPPARAASSRACRHPNIAQLIDAGVSDTGQPYLVLEYVDGLRIDRYCDARVLGVEARVRLFLDVLSAVAHAHARLVVHRDLKPSNVMVGGTAA